jgi:hypothetical protein
MKLTTSPSSYLRHHQQISSQFFGTGGTLHSCELRKPCQHLNIYRILTERLQVVITVGNSKPKANEPHGIHFSPCKDIGLPLRNRGAGSWELNGYPALQTQSMPKMSTLHQRSSLRTSTNLLPHQTVRQCRFARRHLFSRSCQRRKPAPLASDKKGPPTVTIFRHNNPCRRVPR